MPAAVLALVVAAGAAGLLTLRKASRADDARARVVAIARGEVGKSDWRVYDLDTEGYIRNTRPEWCGMFALWCLHQAGMARDWKWIDGKGFAFRLPMTRSPKPGDIAYYNEPYQHHAVFARDLGNGRFIQVNGNGGGGKVTESEQSLSEPDAFYSIAPLAESPQ